MDDAIDALITKTANEFATLKFKLLRKNKTKNKNKLNDYSNQVVHIYNSFTNFNKENFNTLDESSKKKLKRAYIQLRDDSIVLFAALNLNIKLPVDSTEEINLDNTTEYTSDNETETNETETTATVKMATNMEFISLCAKQISKNFDGNFTSLQAFINSIKFLQQVATTDELQELLKSFILTKLDQRALEKIPANPASVEVIITGLSQKIKPDSSKVVEGRMVALTADQKNMREFQKQAEKLAEEYQRALVVEGFPLSLAEEKTIEKTVELCRKNTKSAEVKAVLSATAHTSPAAVVAKMVTQLDLVKQDRLLANAERAASSNKDKTPYETRDRFGNQNNRQSNGQNSQNGARTDGNQRNNSQRNGYNNNNGQNDQGNQNGHNSRNNNYHNNGNQNNNGRNGNGNRNFYANNNNGGAVFSVQGNEPTPLQQQGAPQHQNQQYEDM